ncbi:hypothetical protein GQ55_2G211900 [Panicum hallii var. hallii]|uniref:Uncharacterized protein n=1 Tax=Panicum hallii var. hallii TaxID=1504633 RepID=A0A2T7EQZ3_9POAL|nr:hypothetical protein GQ55_2G211900 [Panicum hallii var. hallii]
MAEPLPGVAARCERRGRRPQLRGPSAIACTASSWSPCAAQPDHGPRVRRVPRRPPRAGRCTAGHGRQRCYQPSVRLGASVPVAPDAACAASAAGRARCQCHTEPHGTRSSSCAAAGTRVPTGLRVHRRRGLLMPWSMTCCRVAQLGASFGAQLLWL